jgi:hypothetical protein
MLSKENKSALSLIGATGFILLILLLAM